MAIQYTYNDVADIPEGYEALYTQNDEGVFNMTQVEGVTAKGKLDEFRENNISLRQQIEDRETESAALQSKFSGVDLEKWNQFQEQESAMAEKQRQIDDQELIDKGDVDTLIERRVQEVLAAKDKELGDMRGGHDETLTELYTQLENYETQFSSLVIDRELASLSADLGVASSALEDVLTRGRATFKVEEGRPVAYDKDGLKMYGADAITPLSVGEWLDGLSDKAPHLFNKSRGTGAGQPSDTPVQDRESGNATDLILAGLANMR
tara:strand:+ start:5232 stop:6026 length:795 start_codon:yes stop_codon:yes gene_type:complete